LGQSKVLFLKFIHFQVELYAEQSPVMLAIFDFRSTQKHLLRTIQGMFRPSVISNGLVASQNN